MWATMRSSPKAKAIEVWNKTTTYIVSLRLTIEEKLQALSHVPEWARRSWYQVRQLFFYKINLDDPGSVTSRYFLQSQFLTNSPVAPGSCHGSKQGRIPAERSTLVQRGRISMKDRVTCLEKILPWYTGWNSLRCCDTSFSWYMTNVNHPTTAAGHPSVIYWTWHHFHLVIVTVFPVRGLGCCTAVGVCLANSSLG
jgi:hypothetical protein